MTAIRTWDPPICRFRVRPAPWQLDTVTRAADESAFDIVYRVIPSGRKTPFMEQLAAGDTVRFGGRFGVPVDEGIAPECDRVVGIATGAGIHVGE